MDAATGTFDDILKIARPELRPVCEALRRRITSLHPDFVEVVWPRLKIASYGDSAVVRSVAQRRRAPT